MKTVHIESREQERQAAEKNGFTCIISIKDDSFHGRYKGETFCCIEKDGWFSLYASWNSESFLGRCTPAYMDEFFQVLA